MEQGLSGGTTNLLRMARSGCQSGSSFVALALTDDSFATAVYPATPEPGAVDMASVDAVVRQLWHDPGLGRGKALVRTIRIGDDRLAVAAVPLAMTGEGQPSGILGVADLGGKSFGVPDLELLSRIAQRLTSYVQARRAVRSQVAAAGGSLDDEAVAPTGSPAGQFATSASDARRTYMVGKVLEASGGAGADRPVPSSAGSWTEGELGSDALGAALGAFGAGLPLPPFPPPAGTAGVDPSSAAAPAPREETTRRETPSPPEPPARALQGDSVRSLLGDDAEIDGLVPLGALLGRAGRLLGAGAATSGSLAVVALEVEGMDDAQLDEVARVARAIRSELRFDDPLARIGNLSFVAVVPLAPGAASGSHVEAHLSGRVRLAVARHPGARVHAAHVVAPLNGGQDADELLRAAVVKLRAR